MTSRSDYLLSGKILLLRSRLWSWRCCVCWRRCWWPEPGKCPLARCGRPECSCTCKRWTAGDPGSRPEIGRCSGCGNMQELWKAVQRGSHRGFKKEGKRKNSGGRLLTSPRFWCKAAHRGFWDSIGSLRNSSSTFDHLDIHGSQFHTHLCLGISRGAERKKESVD